MKFRLIWLLMKYAWWTVRVPNKKLQMRGLIADLQGDLGTMRLIMRIGA